MLCKNAFPQVGANGWREYRERQLESWRGEHLWDELETGSSGNSHESMRMTLVKGIWSLNKSSPITRQDLQGRDRDTNSATNPVTYNSSCLQGVLG